jgi:hypothetical protein
MYVHLTTTNHFSVMSTLIIALNTVDFKILGNNECGNPGTTMSTLKIYDNNVDLNVFCRWSSLKKKVRLSNCQRVGWFLIFGNFSSQNKNLTLESSQNFPCRHK